VAALVWIAFAGMPRAAADVADPRAWWGSTMASLPVLVAAGALDVASGAALRPTILFGVWALVFVALSGLAAELARRSTRARRIHATLWLASFVAAPMFVAAFEFGARSATSHAPELAKTLATTSPLAWSLRSADVAASPYVPFAALVALCALAAHFGRGARA
jgi:hypothetical protein